MSAELTTPLLAVTRTARTVLLIGDTDTGKTTLAAAIANAAFAAGRSVAVVDADIGQSEIGPPATAGLGFVTCAIRTTGDLVPASLIFVGTTSASTAIRRHVDSTRRLVDDAYRHGVSLVVVDTTGFIRGAAAARLKRTKIDALRPDHTIVLQRDDECEAILAHLRQCTYTEVTLLPIPAAIRPKSPKIRAQRRAERFRGAFASAMEHEYSMRSVKWIGGSHFSGSQQSATQPQHITNTPATWYNNLLVGLEDGDGRLLSLGICDSADFERRTVHVRAAIDDPKAVHAIRAGLMRVTADGRELAHLRRGDF